MVNALVLGLTAIAKNPNLGSYRILQRHARHSLEHGGAARARQALARLPVGVGHYNRGIGQMREWFVKGLALSGVKREDVPVELNI